MSQRRHKKDLSMMDNVVQLTDQELRAALKDFMVSPGPITDSTRDLYRKKLATLMEEQDKETNSKGHLDPAISDDDDTSDEDYEVKDEELDEDDYDEEDDDEDEELVEEEEDLLSELQDETLSSSRINEFVGFTNRTDSDVLANRVPRVIQFALVSFFALIFSFYLMSTNKLEFLEPLKPFKDITKKILILLALSPIAYVVYRVFKFYRIRRHVESQRMCELVSQSLELLQSPETPKGLMPILHIRDTLLTPAERKAKATNLLWQKAVKFVEENESRVKVEMVNVDGEDFRAWKWIGSRKM